MLNRFLSADLGREILARSTQLEIKLYRCRNNRLHASYEIHGCVGTDPFTEDDDDEDEGDLVSKKPNNDAEDMRFIIDLLNQFERVERGG